MIGDPEKKGIEIGPVVDKSQYDRIMNIISTAANNKEGTLLHGGRALGDKVVITSPTYSNRDHNSYDRASTSNLQFSPILQIPLRFIRMKFLDP